jgi:hypothetical protein
MLPVFLYEHPMVVGSAVVLDRVGTLKRFAYPKPFAPRGDDGGDAAHLQSKTSSRRYFSDWCT